MDGLGPERSRGAVVVAALASLLVGAWVFPPLGIGGRASGTPLADTPEDKARFDAAISLHDKGQYEAAAAAFRDLLAAHPDDPTLLCELANSLMAGGKAEEAIQHAGRALDRPGASIAFCSTVLGSALDAQGELKKGEKVFRKGIKASPDVAMLHFNLGVNQAQQKRPEEAIEEFQESIRLSPSLASGWRALAISWQAQNRRPRAFAAYARFLALEPSGGRAEAALEQLEALLFQGVEHKGNDSKTGQDQISVTLDADSKGKDDATRALEMSMSLVATTRFIEEWKDRSDAEFFAHAFDSVLTIFAEMDDSGRRKDGFWSASVMPYFRDAKTAGHLPTMAWDVRRSRKDADVAAWLEAHASEVEAYHAWSASWKPATSGR